MTEKKAHCGPAALRRLTGSFRREPNAERWIGNAYFGRPPPE
jgi:hypothetical protein